MGLASLAATSRSSHFLAAERSLADLSRSFTSGSIAPGPAQPPGGSENWAHERGLDL